MVVSSTKLFLMVTAATIKEDNLSSRPVQWVSDEFYNIFTFVVPFWFGHKSKWCIDALSSYLKCQLKWQTHLHWQLSICTSSFCYHLSYFRFLPNLENTSTTITFTQTWLSLLQSGSPFDLGNQQDISCYCTCIISYSAILMKYYTSFLINDWKQDKWDSTEDLQPLHHVDG